MISNPKIGDIFRDENGRLWRVTQYLASPSISMEAVEPNAPLNPNYLNQLLGSQQQSATVPLFRDKLFDSIDASMWNGFNRIWTDET